VQVDDTAVACRPGDPREQVGPEAAATKCPLHREGRLGPRAQDIARRTRPHRPELAEPAQHAIHEGAVHDAVRRDGLCGIGPYAGLAHIAHEAARPGFGIEAEKVVENRVAVRPPQPSNGTGRFVTR
jgi:hypothetical protein